MKTPVSQVELKFLEQYILPHFDLPRGDARWGALYELGSDDFGIDFELDEAKFRLFGADFMEDSDFQNHYTSCAAEAGLDPGQTTPIELDGVARQELHSDFVYLIKDPETIAHLVPQQPQFQQWGMVHVDKQRPQSYKYVPIYLDRYAIFQLN